MGPGWDGMKVKLLIRKVTRIGNEGPGFLVLSHPIPVPSQDGTGMGPHFHGTRMGWDHFFMGWDETGPGRELPRVG